MFCLYLYICLVWLTCDSDMKSLVFSQRALHSCWLFSYEQFVFLLLRINFVRVCRITLDHIPLVLREYFKYKINQKLPSAQQWQDTPKWGAWLESCERWRSKLSPGLLICLETSSLLPLDEWFHQKDYPLHAKVGASGSIKCLQFVGGAIPVTA